MCRQDARAFRHCDHDAFWPGRSDAAKFQRAGTITVRPYRILGRNGRELAAPQENGM